MDTPPTLTYKMAILLNTQPIIFSARKWLINLVTLISNPLIKSKRLFNRRTIPICWIWIQLNSNSLAINQTKIITYTINNTMLIMEVMLATPFTNNSEEEFFESIASYIFILTLTIKSNTFFIIINQSIYNYLNIYSLLLTIIHIPSSPSLLPKSN